MRRSWRRLCFYRVCDVFVGHYCVEMLKVRMIVTKITVGRHEDAIAPVELSSCGKRHRPLPVSLWLAGLKGGINLVLYQKYARSTFQQEFHKQVRFSSFIYDRQAASLYRK